MLRVGFLTRHQSPMHSAFPYITLYYKSKPTDGNEHNLIFKDKETNSERLSVLVKETHQGMMGT